MVLTCEACGRPIAGTPLVVTWTAGFVRRIYRVCPNCNNDFVVSVTDLWAKAISETVTISDNDIKYPPLIENGAYKQSF